MVNSDLVDDEPDIRVGVDVVLDIGGREATWHVVGIIPTDSRGSAVYVSRDDYAYAARTPGRARWCRSGPTATMRPRRTSWRRGSTSISTTWA